MLPKQSQWGCIGCVPHINTLSVRGPTQLCQSGSIFLCVIPSVGGIRLTVQSQGKREKIRVIQSGLVRLTYIEPALHSEDILFGYKHGTEYK